VITARLKEVEDSADRGHQGSSDRKRCHCWRCHLEYMQLERVVGEERKQLLEEIGRTASASDQKLTAVFGDLKKQNQEV